MRQAPWAVRRPACFVCTISGLQTSAGSLDRQCFGASTSVRAVPCDGCNIVAATATRPDWLVVIVHAEVAEMVLLLLWFPLFAVRCPMIAAAHACRVLRHKVQDRRRWCGV